MANQNAGKVFLNGIVNENPIFIQVIGMCPTLAVTTSAINGIGMGLTTMVVLMASNFFISLIKKFVPNEIRIPVFIIIIASFVTMIGLALQAYLPSLNDSLGIFIPLIVVNCLILARAEAFASKNNPIMSFVDGFGMGIGFTIALFIMGSIREILGNGSLFSSATSAGIVILPDNAHTIAMILPPGAFLTLGCLMALLNFLRRKK